MTIFPQLTDSHVGSRSHTCIESREGEKWKGGGVRGGKRRVRGGGGGVTGENCLYVSLESCACPSICVWCVCCVRVCGCYIFSLHTNKNRQRGLTFHIFNLWICVLLPQTRVSFIKLQLVGKFFNIHVLVKNILLISRYCMIFFSILVEMKQKKL